MAQESTIPTASTAPVSPFYMEQSKGHIGFTATFEYYWAASGDLYRANRHNPIFPDGYRAGRFESTAHAASYFLKMAGLQEEEE